MLLRLRYVILFLALSLTMVLIGNNVIAGKLYIKPDLERNRAERLIQMANKDFWNAKIHMTLSPETAITEFKQAKRKFKDAIAIIESFGAGYYTPGDVEDMTKRMKECDQWIEECKRLLQQEQGQSIAREEEE